MAMTCKTEKRVALEKALPKRRTSGFTMVETLGVVAIIVALLGVGFVAVWQMRISTTQMELDNTAREIFVAAQNHLAAAESQGMLGGSIKYGTEDTVSSEKGDYYFVYPGGTDADPNNKGSILGVMLPFGSIDETVRSGGSYVIRYQKSTGKVLEVFFAKTSGYGTPNPGFSESTYSTLIAGYSDKGGADHKEARKNYNGGIIGWYGGEDLSGEMGKLKAPVMEVINSDVLEVKVTNASASDSTVADQKVQLYVEGVSSGATMYFDLSDATDSGNSGSGISTDPYVVVLDDVTSASGGFEVVATSRVNVNGEKKRDGDFAPGEDLKLYAQVMLMHDIANIPRSATFTTNSLFASAADATPAAPAQGQANAGAPAGAPANGGTPAGDPANSGTQTGASSNNATGGTNTTSAPKATNSKSLAKITAEAVKSAGKDSYVAIVSSLRHLSNLANLTGENATSFSVGDKSYTLLTAKQMTDLSWNGFTNNLVTLKGAGAGTNVQIHARADTASSDANTFLAVSPGYKLSYDGDGHWISGLTIKNGTHAGLFGKLANGSSAKNLELIDFDVKASGENGAAGSLVGDTGETTTISNVLVRDKLSSDVPAGNTDAVEARVAGKVAGGLVGTLGKGSKVSQSAAAVFVGNTTASGNRAESTVVEATTIAGGLVGQVGGDGATIEYSYSGGRVEDVASSNPPAVKYPDAGNVVSTGTAGGLVGVASNAAITGCYSTCSVQGGAGATSLVGGLVGSATGTVSNSYAVGKVSGGEGASVGAFAGASGATFSGDNYLDIINYEAKVRPLGDLADDAADPTTITPIDANTKTFTDFVMNDATNLAVPYSKNLALLYQGRFPLKTISKMGATLDNTKGVLNAHLTSHYGDWPAPETLVINTKS